MPLWRTKHNYPLYVAGKHPCIVFGRMICSTGVSNYCKRTKWYLTLISIQDTVQVFKISIKIKRFYSCVIYQHLVQMISEGCNFGGKDSYSPISELSSAIPILFLAPGNFLEGLGVGENMLPWTFPIDDSAPVNKKLYQQI